MCLLKKEKKSMRNVVRNSSVAIGVVLFGALLASILGFAMKASAKSSSIFTQSSALATTTVSFMSAGNATTTYQFDSPTFTAGVTGKVANMQGIDASSLYILLNASSSNTVLEWQIQFSNNNIDWYGESASLSAANVSQASSTSGTVIQEASTTVTHLWSPGATGNAFKVISLPTTPTFHERVVFFLPIGSAPGAVYNETDLKQNPTTP